MKIDFSHGGDVATFAKNINCDIDEVIDLSSNINFIKPKLDIDFNTLDISSYPKYDKLYKKISKLYKVQSEQIELFNGGSSAIFSMFDFFDTRHCYIYSPAYLEYKKAATKHNYTYTLVNRYINIKHEVLENSLVVFVNPSTPDGLFYDMDSLMKKWISKNCTIFIDESFLDFTSYESCIKYLKNYDKLYILKSMTKFYSSAGIRLGIILSNEENIKKVKEKEPLWKISQFDSLYIQKALEDKSFAKISKVVNIKNKEQLIGILKQSKYVSEIYPSVANYVLVKLKGINAKAICEKLQKDKIMVRDCSNFDYLDDSFIRVAVKSKDMLLSLEKALKSF